MRRPACSRTWEAEAIEDDRLDRATRASFERHRVSCEVCGQELERLARIADAVRELPQYPSQAIERRRARMTLLQRANAKMMRARGNRASVWTAVTIAACVPVLAIVGTHSLTMRHAPPPVRAPAFEIVDVAHANWTTTSAAGTVQIALSLGTTAIHVEHLAHNQRFLVHLPDGDLEVRGTRFLVNVTDRRTTHLEVSEGVVALRLLGRPELVLVAGDQWSAPPAPVAIVADNTLEKSGAPRPDSTSTVANLPAASQPRLIPRSPVPTAVPTAMAMGVGTAELSPVPSSFDQSAPSHEGDGDGYAASVRAFKSGDYAGADLLLTAFMREHPSDARSEDAAFLRAVSHARLGDAAGATTLARDYLQQYPLGLRHREAERLARRGGQGEVPTR